MKKLIFVYNADSGYLNAVIDVMHKKLQPHTYECGLCALTYSTVRMKKEWKNFVASLPYESVFMHRDEFHASYPDNHEMLPAIFVEDRTSLTTMVSAEAFTRLDSLDDLMHYLEDALSRQL